jgi:hypothetical protein
VQYKIKDLPVIILDDWLSRTAVREIKQEIEYLEPHLEQPSKNNSALDNNGNPLRKNTSIWLDHVYINRNYSRILKHLNSIFDPQLMQQLANQHRLWNYLETSTEDSTLLQRWLPGDNYPKHVDKCPVTAIYTCIVSSDKQGGNLLVEDTAITTHQNQLILLPGCLQHQTLPLELGVRWSANKFIAHSTKNLHLQNYTSV